MSIREDSEDEPVWYEICEIENWSKHGDDHCLLYSGIVTMC